MLGWAVVIGVNVEGEEGVVRGEQAYMQAAPWAGGGGVVSRGSVIDVFVFMCRIWCCVVFCWICFRE